MITLTAFRFSEANFRSFRANRQAAWLQIGLESGFSGGI